jgi:Delta7-sterol 5-desaturase
MPKLKLIHYIWIVGGRYFVVAGLAFLVFYILFPHKFKYKRLQAGFPAVKQYRNEIIYSIATVAIFIGVAWLFLQTSLRSYTLVYTELTTLDWWYIPVSVVLMIVLHDTYFYWMHRLMHHPKIYRWVHLVHHKSTNPDPWTSYSFHPIEAVIEAGILPIIVFLIPTHPLALAFFILFMIVYNVYGHLGYEIFPKWLVQSRFGNWLNTSTNHNLHHQFFTGNFGLYFRFWDEWMGTTRADYQEKLNQVVRNNES